VRCPVHPNRCCVALEAADTGEVRINFPLSEAVTQRDGYIHAGIIAAIVDTACGGTANILTRPLSDVLTVEYEVIFFSCQGGRVRRNWKSSQALMYINCVSRRCIGVREWWEGARRNNAGDHDRADKVSDGI